MSGPGPSRWRWSELVRGVFEGGFARKKKQWLVQLLARGKENVLRSLDFPFFLQC